MDDDQFENKFLVNGRFDDKTFIERGDWETCCLKQRPKEGEKPTGALGYNAFGIITDTAHPIHVMLRGKTPEDDFKTFAMYESVDALLADGWIVD